MNRQPTDYWCHTRELNSAVPLCDKSVALPLRHSSIQKLLPFEKTFNRPSSYNSYNKPLFYNAHASLSGKSRPRHFLNDGFPFSTPGTDTQKLSPSFRIQYFPTNKYFSLAILFKTLFVISATSTLLSSYTLVTQVHDKARDLRGPWNTKVLRLSSCRGTHYCGAACGAEEESVLRFSYELHIVP